MPHLGALDQWLRWGGGGVEPIPCMGSRDCQKSCLTMLIWSLSLQLTEVGFDHFNIPTLLQVSCLGRWYGNTPKGFPEVHGFITQWLWFAVKPRWQNGRYQST